MLRADRITFLPDPLLSRREIAARARLLMRGHPTTDGMEGTLGMTSVYTHTRPETLRREIFRALRLWPASLELAHGWVSMFSG